MTQLDHITAYTGIMPYFSNFADTDDPEGEMAIATEQFLKYVNDGFTPQYNTQSDKLNLLSDEIEAAANSVSENTQIVTDKTAISVQKAEEASSSAADALNAKIAAEALFHNFSDRYLGVKPTYPVTDNDGEPLEDGALFYHNTAPKGLHVYDLELSEWINTGFSPASHSGLSGLKNDDHPHYLTEQRMNTAIGFKLNFYGGQ